MRWNKYLLLFVFVIGLFLIGLFSFVSADPPIPPEIPCLPTGVEICDGIDNDCNNLIDDNLTSEPCDLQLGVCNGSVKTCGGALGWLECNASAYGLDYVVNETLVNCDGLDNDCDGTEDEGCPCVENETKVCGIDVGICTFGVQVCTNETWGDCNGTMPVTEICGNGIDEDCNGADLSCAPAPSPNGGSCFPAGTKIIMSDKSIKFIEDVRVGDKILSYDGRNFVKAKVIELESPIRDHLYTISFRDGTILQLTNEHPVYTKEGWKSIDPVETFNENSFLKVKELKAGDFVLNSNLEFVEILFINYEFKENIQTYNLKRVSNTNSFFAGEYLVHNKNGGPTTSYECNDGIDNDNDGFVDYPTDPGCDSYTDDDEGDDVFIPDQNISYNLSGLSYVEWTFDQGSLQGLLKDADTYLISINGIITEENYNLIKFLDIQLYKLSAISIPEEYSVLEYFSFENIKDIYFDSIYLTFDLEPSMLESENEEEKLEFVLLKLGEGESWEEFDINKKSGLYISYLDDENFLSPIILATKVKQKNKFWGLFSDLFFISAIILFILIITTIIILVKRVRRRRASFL